MNIYFSFRQKNNVRSIYSLFIVFIIIILFIIIELHEKVLTKIYLINLLKSFSQTVYKLQIIQMNKFIRFNQKLYNGPHGN